MPAARLGLREFEVDGLLFLRNFDALHPFEFLDAALHLLGLGGRVAEAVDEHFELLDPLPLVLVSRFDLGAPRRLFLQVLLVIAGVEVNPLVPDLDDLLHRDVEKKAVVRDQHTCVRIIVQVFFQPVAGLEVQVIGGLVEQQQVGLFQQQLSQGDAHLPAAGEFFRAAMPIGGGKSQTAQHHSRLRFKRISVAVLELGVNGVEAVGDLLVLGARPDRFPPIFSIRLSISCSMESRSPNTDMHSAITERPESVRPS